MWVYYQPKKDGNLPKSTVLKDILEYGKHTIKDGFTQRIACIFISKALPLLYPNSQELENQFYQLEKLPVELHEERLKSIPEIPINLREQLKREVREEILGRKSAQDLVDLGRKAREGSNANKRTFTSPDLQDAIKRQKIETTTSFSEPSDKPLNNSPLPPSSLSIPTIPAISLHTPVIPSFQTLHATSDESSNVNNNNNLPTLQRTLSTPPLSNPGDIIQIFPTRKQAIPSSPPADGRVLREVQALRSIIAGMQKDIDQLKETIDKREKKERNLNSDIIKMKAEISILSATLSSASGLFHK